VSARGRANRHAARGAYLALQVQEALGRDPHAGDLYVFRGGSGDLIKILWHDGIGMSLYAKPLEKGRFTPAFTRRRRGGDIGGAAGLHARRDRLAEPAAHLPPDRRWIVPDDTIFRGQTRDFVIPSPAWLLIPRPCRTMSMR
jgi:hypothetical protein